MDSLFINYDLIIKSYTEIAGTFEALENLTKKYNFDNNENSEMRLYEGLKEMTFKLANQVNAEQDIFKSKIKGLFMYEKHNMTTLKEIYDARHKIHSEYVRHGSPPFASNSMRMQGIYVVM